MANEQDKKLLLDVVPSNFFSLIDGREIRNLVELADALKTMSDNVFGYHVNFQQNDLSEWVKYAVKDKKLAEDFQKAETKHEMLELIEKRLSKIKNREDIMGRFLEERKKLVELEEEKIRKGQTKKKQEEILDKESELPEKYAKLSKKLKEKNSLLKEEKQIKKDIEPALEIKNPKTIEDQKSDQSADLEQTKLKKKEKAIQEKLRLMEERKRQKELLKQQKLEERQKRLGEKKRLAEQKIKERELKRQAILEEKERAKKEKLYIIEAKKKQGEEERRKKKENKLFMRVDKHIKKALDTGLSEKQISKNLMGIGWSKSLVQDRLNQFRLINRNQQKQSGNLPDEFEQQVMKQISSRIKGGSKKNRQIIKELLDSEKKILEKEREIEYREKKIQEIEERIERKLDGANKKVHKFFSIDFIQGIIVGLLVIALGFVVYLKFFIQ